MPKISVIMPVYRSCDFLDDAIKSILDQTLEDFEFLIIVDEPTGPTKLILEDYSRIDDRIRVHYPEKRLGLIGSLNYGCHLARGAFIARMDADDISIADRFEKQIEFLENHPEVGIVGSWFDYIDASGEKIHELRSPILPNVIRWRLLFGNVIAHPTVMMRRSIIERIGYYSFEAEHAEDYDLWVRASEITDIANIPEILLKYRKHGGSICSTSDGTQEQTVINVSHHTIAGLCGKDISPCTIENLRNVVINQPLSDIDQAEKVGELVRMIYATYTKLYKLSDVESNAIDIFTGSLYYKLSRGNGKLSLLNRLMFLYTAFTLDPFYLHMRDRFD